MVYKSFRGARYSFMLGVSEIFKRNDPELARVYKSDRIRKGKSLERERERDGEGEREKEKE